MSKSLKAHLLLLAVVALWGSTFVLVKDALRNASPLLFNLIRMVLGFCSLALLYRRHLRSITWSSVRGGAVVGACLAAGYQFQTAGLALTTPSKSAFITGLVVVLVPMLCAVPWLRSATMHGPRWNAWIGAGLGFAGVVLLTTPAGASVAADFSSIGLGDWLTLACAVGFALHVIALAHTSSRIDLPQLATLQIGFSALFMAATLPLERHIHFHPTPRLVLQVAVVSFLGTAAAFTIQAWAQQVLPATHTALILALEPVFAAVMSFFLLGERLHARAALGALSVLAGILLTELFPRAIPASAHEGA